MRTFSPFALVSSVRLLALSAICGAMCSEVATAAILDDVSGATAAYSVRKLSNAYAGPAINVRRSSDNSTTDIGFDAFGNLDLTALTTFAAGGDAFVTTWYDQVGANDVTQGTSLRQPIIVSSGNVVTGSNGATALRFTGSNSTGTTSTSDALEASVDLYVDNVGATVISAGEFEAEPNSSQIVSRFYTMHTSNSTRLSLGGDDGLLAAGYRNGGSFLDSNTSHDPVLGQTFVSSLVADASGAGSTDTVDVFVDGNNVLGLTGRNLTTDPDTWVIGAQRASGERGLIGTMNEVIVFGAALDDANRQMVEASQISAFVTVVPEPASLVLCGLGLVGLAAARRRRAR